MAVFDEVLFYFAVCTVLCPIESLIAKVTRHRKRVKIAQSAMRTQIYLCLKPKDLYIVGIHVGKKNLVKSE